MEYAIWLPIWLPDQRDRGGLLDEPADDERVGDNSYEARGPNASRTDWEPVFDAPGAGLLMGSWADVDGSGTPTLIDSSVADALGAFTLNVPTHPRPQITSRPLPVSSLRTVHGDSA